MPRQFPTIPLDINQRYTIDETALYLRKCRASIYSDIRKGDLPIIKDGKRTYVPGEVIAERSRLPRNGAI